jgi:Pectic acid lyase
MPTTTTSTMAFRCLLILVVGVVTGMGMQAIADEALAVDARSAMLKGVAFYHDRVATEGGYVYRYASDLGLREGEEKTGPSTVWIEPPGTPAVGMAYLEAYRRTKEASLLQAARDTARCLIRGQLHSGGWSNSIDFDPSDRKKHAYRVDGAPTPKARNVSTLDDNKSQSAIRFLASLDQVLEFNDKELHEATTYALDSLVRVQFPNGAWPQGFSESPNAADFPVLKARYPKTWSREFPKVDYKGFYTFNDDSIVDTLRLMMLAHQVYGNEQYRNAALKAGEFLLLAQMPDPQPAWAQQYDREMQPAWARKFEPPSVSGGESQGIIQALTYLYQETGETKYVDAARKALRYLLSSQLPNGKLARFYELETNKPLYFTREYVLTYDDSDLPTHYGFIVSNELSMLEQKIDRLVALSAVERTKFSENQRGPQKVKRPSENEVRKVIASMDARGGWVEKGTLSTHRGDTAPTEIIQSKTFMKNLDLLSRFLATDR